MNTQYESLEFTVIINQLKEHALSDKAKAAFDTLVPYLNEDLCIRKMEETTAARKILDACGIPPLSPMKGLEEILTLAQSGAMLIPEQLTAASQFAASCKRLSSYLARGETISNTVSSYCRSIIDLTGLKESIDLCIREDSVMDEASTGLRNIRRKKEYTESLIKEKLAHILSSRKEFLADCYITNRNGHYVVPVKRKFQSQFGGTAIEVSGKGTTVFMEPASISKLQAELEGLAIDEDCEVRRILYTLTSEINDYSSMIYRNMEAMEVLDIIFAKARLSASMNASAVAIGGERRLIINQGRHPLLLKEHCVPLDFYMDEHTSGVIITGPNTGGKTVAVKTAGLLSLMAQCGLHIPCGSGSYIAMQDGYWCDIGDSQNISQNLSTFSGHMTNVIHILSHASKDSIVLFDELGSGTDPAEGMGIAIAVLEELRLRGCMFLVTTHYPQVKTYAEQSERVVSARMAFDKESLQPLYLLEMGKSGESCALHIARKLGLAAHLLERAHREVYPDQEQEVCTNCNTMPIPRSLLIRSAPAIVREDLTAKFSMGDSVLVLPTKEIGIVYRPADQHGDVIVQVKDKKHTIRHNRLQLHVPASQLYPPDYDFSIIFDTVQNRKANRIMSKRYDPSVSIVHDEQMP